jgi:hypothetical protein
MFTLPSRSETWMLPSIIQSLDTPQPSYTRRMVTMRSTMKLENVGSCPVNKKTTKGWTEQQRLLAEAGIKAKDLAHLRNEVNICVSWIIVRVEKI